MILSICSQVTTDFGICLKESEQQIAFRDVCKRFAENWIEVLIDHAGTVANQAHTL